MRRLFPLVAAVVLVDTMFFAAVAPLLPHYTRRAGAVQVRRRRARGRLPGGHVRRPRYRPAGLAARFGVKPTLLAGLTLLGITSLSSGSPTTWSLLDAARFAQGVGGACSWAGGLAWLVCAAPADRRGDGDRLGAGRRHRRASCSAPCWAGAATVVGPELVFSAVASWPSAWPSGRGRCPGRRPSRRPALRTLGARAAPALGAGRASGCSRCPALFAGVARGAGAAAARRSRRHGAVDRGDLPRGGGGRGGAEPVERARCRTGTDGSRRSGRAGRRGRDGGAAAAAGHGGADGAALRWRSIAAARRLLGARDGPPLRRLGGRRARPGAGLRDRQPGLGARAT